MEDKRLGVENRAIGGLRGTFPQISSRQKSASRPKRSMEIVSHPTLKIKDFQ
jgi:hypothetical protein